MDLTYLSSYQTPSKSIRLITIEDRFFISWVDFERQEGRLLEALGIEHGLVLLYWCIETLRIAEA